jgi:hypothetical protein
MWYELEKATENCCAISWTWICSGAAKRRFAVVGLAPVAAACATVASVCGEGMTPREPNAPIMQTPPNAYAWCPSIGPR